MKHLKTFNELIESASAGSQSNNDVLPFKYSMSYDYRIGYSKIEFISDLRKIMDDLDLDNQRDLLLLIKRLTGYDEIEEIEKINSMDLNLVIKEVEEFLNSKADFQINQYPDGYYLCFENIKFGGITQDIYYHPIKKKIKVVPQTGNAIEKEIIIDLDKFRPIEFGIDTDDFISSIEQVDNIKRKDISYKNPQ